MTHAFPYESKRFERHGVSLAYVDEGTGPTVLMVHGNPTWSFHWRELILMLKPDHRCIAIDHVGCGRSDKPPDSEYTYTLGRRIEDLEALVERLDLQNVNLVVHDWGGAIGLGWATRNPERVAKIVVLNSAAFFMPAKRFPWSLHLARLPGIGELLVRGANAFVLGALRYCVARRRLPPQIAGAYLEPYDSWRNRIAVHRFVQDIPRVPSDPAFPVLDEISDRLPRLRDKPILLAWGMRDFVFDPTFFAEWQRRFPHAEAYRFDDCGHFVLEDAGPQVAGLVRDFISPKRDGESDDSDP